MMELNQNAILIAVVCVGLLVCYFLWREVKRTQTDVQGLKVFSANVAKYIEPSQQPLSDTCEAVTPPPPPQEPQEDAVTEEKKDK